MPYRTVAPWVKAIRESRDAVQENFHTGRPHVENNTVELLYADRRWTANELAAKGCTSKTDGKRCQLLHVPAAPPSSSAQEKTTTLDGTEPHLLHDNTRSLPSLLLSRTSCAADNGRFWIICRTHPIRVQNERTTARDSVQHKR